MIDRAAFLRRMDNDVRKLNKARAIEDLVDTLVPPNPGDKVVLRIPDPLWAEIRRLHCAAMRLRTNDPHWKPEFGEHWTVRWYGTMLVPESWPS